MSEFSLIKGLLFKLYTDKNPKIFKEALSLLDKEGTQDGIFGLIYSDTNIDEKIEEKFLKINPRMTIFKVIDMKYTNCMDNKLNFHEIMKESKYTPHSFSNISEIKNNLNTLFENNDIFFIKKANSTLGKGISIFKFKDLNNITTTEDEIIQKSSKNPLLINNRRFKLRILVVIFKENIYFHKKYWGCISKIEYNPYEENIEIFKEMNILNMNNSFNFFIDDIPSLNNINNEIIKSLSDFKKYYSKEINNIKDNLYTILGLDYVISQNGAAEIIEINHRPNFWHGEEISKKTDIITILDLYKLLINNSSLDTDFIII